MQAWLAVYIIFAKGFVFIGVSKEQGSAADFFNQAEDNRQRGEPMDIMAEGRTNYTYLVRCSDGSLYCGWTNRLRERIEAHNAGKGAKYTRSRRPVVLVYYEAFSDRQGAMKREAAIKRMSRKQKLELIAAGTSEK